MIEYFLAGVVMIGIAAWVARPLFTERPLAGIEDDERLSELVEAKQAVYRSILDLEFDLKVGKVSDRDHAVMRTRHEAEAARILKEIDRMEDANVFDTIEVEIAEARKRLGDR